MATTSTSENALQPAGVACPGCGTLVPNIDTENSCYFACAQCYTFFRKKGKTQPEIVKKFYPSEMVVPPIPVGTTGTLDGKQFTVVGFMKKTDTTHENRWHEYLLYNNTLDNYFTLAEYKGHWTLLWVSQLKGIKLYGAGSFHEMRSFSPNRTFRQYTKYSFEIEWASGEFDWDITTDEGPHMEVYEFVDAPDIIVTEEDGDKKVCYQGKFVDRTDVAVGFGVSLSSLPPKFGAGVLEIPKFIEQEKPMNRFTLLLIGIVLLSPFIISMFKPSRLVFNEVYRTTKDTSAWSSINPIVTPPFEVKHSGALNVEFVTNITNNWIELQASLVNDKTGKTYEFTKALEFYQGYEGGESWSEGDFESDVNFSSVPAGTYHINLYPYAETSIPIDINVRVEQNTVLYSNIAWMLAAVLTLPILRSWRKSAYENNIF
jgi:hypothetical protein